MSLMEDVQLHYVDTLTEIDVGAECLTLSLARQRGGRVVAEVDLIIPIGSMKLICEQMDAAMHRKLAS